MLRRLINLCISLGFWVVDSAAKFIRRILGETNPGTCVVLYYHVVKTDHRERFARQMDTLIRVARPISLDGAPVWKSGNNYVAVTFDDGFQGSIEIALPELVRRNIPVTIFIPSGCLGLPAPWLENTKSPDYGGFVMNAEQIKEIGKDELVSIGSHCVTHCRLLLLSEEEAKKEIFQSKLQLESILGKKVKTMSFPHGAFNSRHVELARAAGYERVFSIVPSLAFCSPEEYVTGRVRVDPTEWRVEFRLKLSGAYRWLPLASSLKHKVKSLIPGNQN